MDLRESVQCPECGTWGWTGSKCPNGICGYVHGKSLGQNMQKAMGETADEIGAAASKMAEGTRQAAGEVATAVGDEVAAQGKMAATGAAVGLGAAFSVGGFWMGMSSLLGLYVGLIGTPSLVALLIHTKVLHLFVSALGVLCGALFGLLIAFKIGIALRNRRKSCIWLFVPLAIAAVVLTMRAPDAASAWWSRTPWW